MNHDQNDVQGWLLRMTIDGVRVAALSPNDQIRYFSVCALQALLENVADPLEQLLQGDVSRVLTPVQLSEVSRLVGCLDACSVSVHIGDDRPVDVILTDPCWSRARAIANEILDKHGWRGIPLPEGTPGVNDGD